MAERLLLPAPDVRLLSFLGAAAPLGPAIDFTPVTKQGIGTLFIGAFPRPMLVRCQSGEAVIQAILPGQVFRIRLGDLFLLPSYTDLRIVAAGTFDVTLAPVQGDDVDVITERLDALFRNDWLAGLLDRLASEDIDPAADNGYFRALSMLVRNELKRQATVEITHRGGGLAPWQIRRVHDFAAERLTTKLTLSELAGVVDLSVFHFCRAFKKSMGNTPHRWLQAQRIERAKALLVSGIRVIDVGLEVGYENPGHFARVFRRATGISPRTFKRLGDGNA